MASLGLRPVGEPGDDPGVTGERERAASRCCKDARCLRGLGSGDGSGDDAIASQL